MKTFDSSKAEVTRILDSYGLTDYNYSIDRFECDTNLIDTSIWTNSEALDGNTPTLLYKFPRFLIGNENELELFLQDNISDIKKKARFISTLCKFKCVIADRDTIECDTIVFYKSSQDVNMKSRLDLIYSIIDESSDLELEAFLNVFKYVLSDTSRAYAIHNIENESLSFEKTSNSKDTAHVVLDSVKYYCILCQFVNTITLEVVPVESGLFQKLSSKLSIAGH